MYTLGQSSLHVHEAENKLINSIEANGINGESCLAYSYFLIAIDPRL